MMKTVLMTLLIAALLLIAGAVAFVYSGVYDVAASSRHGALSSWILETTMHASVERRAQQVQVPEDLGDRSLLLAGVNDFDEMCVQCHGAPGEDPAAIGEGLNPSPPDLAEAAREMTAAELFWITRNGIRMTGMPAWGVTHEDEALWPVVAFMTALPEMDAAKYADLLEAAEGMGHHAGDSAASEHSHPAAEEPPSSHEHEKSDAAEDASETEHDHSSHEH